MPKLVYLSLKLNPSYMGVLAGRHWVDYVDVQAFLNDPACICDKFQKHMDISWLILSFSDVCVYKTAQYSQGQTWNDGCQYKCRCDDSSKGLYICNDR